MTDSEHGWGSQLIDLPVHQKRLWIVKALKARRWSSKRWDMMQETDQGTQTLSDGRYVGTHPGSMLWRSVENVKGANKFSNEFTGWACSISATIWVDGGFDGEPFMQWVITVCGWIVQVVLRPEQTKGLCWKKTLDGWTDFRLVDGLSSISQDYERCQKAQALIYLAMIRLCSGAWRKINPLSLQTSSNKIFLPSFFIQFPHLVWMSTVIIAELLQKTPLYYITAFVGKWARLISVFGLKSITSNSLQPVANTCFPLLPYILKTLPPWRLEAYASPKYIWLKPLDLSLI